MESTSTASASAAAPTNLTYCRPLKKTGGASLTLSSTTTRKVSTVTTTALGFCSLPFCRSCPAPAPAPAPSTDFYCGVVSNPDAAVASDDSDSEASLDNLSKNNNRSRSNNNLSVVTSLLTAGWKNQLLKMSNIASLLCVLDCTILPIVTIILPFFGLVAASPAQMEWLHQAGHAVALGFVLPVGGLATAMNYKYAHKTLWIASLGWLGLTLVVGANAGCSLVPHGAGGVVGVTLHKALHYLHHGIQHRVANLTGCALLLLSNYLSHKRQAALVAAAAGGGGGGTCAVHGPGCTHNH